MFQSSKSNTVCEKSPNLLLVENDREIGNWLIEKLDKRINSDSFKWALNLNEACEKLKSFRADIIILDLRLPDGNGLELLKKIRKEKLQTTVYVFSVNTELKGTCLRLGAHQFFDKSNECEVLLNVLREKSVIILD